MGLKNETKLDSVCVTIVALSVKTYVNMILNI